MAIKSYEFMNPYGVVNSKNPNSLRINSLGEGALWVCNINGNLENLLVNNTQ